MLKMLNKIICIMHSSVNLHTDSLCPFESNLFLGHLREIFFYHLKHWKLNHEMSMKKKCTHFGFSTIFSSKKLTDTFL